MASKGMDDHVKDCSAIDSKAVPRRSSRREIKGNVTREIAQSGGVEATTASLLLRIQTLRSQSLRMQILRSRFALS
jgi:hypothetical protein